MAGIIDEILSRYGGDINQAIGYGEDIQRFGSFKEANQYLEGKRQQRENVQKFGNIMNKLNYIDWNNLPMQKQVDNVAINEQHPDFITPELSMNPAVKQWGEYKKRYDDKNEDGTPKLSGSPLDFKSFIEYYPELKGTLPEQYYKKSSEMVDMTPDEYKIAAYKSAGLSDEEIAWYEQNKKSIESVDNYNKMVKNYVSQMIPNIKSRFGKMGDIYANQIETKANDMLVPESVPQKNQWKIDIKDGKVIKMNTTTGNYSITDIEPGVKTDPKKWDIFIDEDGKITGTTGQPYWGERVQGKDGAWQIEYRDMLNKQEKDDWQAGNDKRDKTGVYTPKSPTGRRSSRGPGRFNMNKMDMNQVKSIKPGDIGTKYKSLEQIKELQSNSEYLSEDTQKAIDEYLQKGPEPDYRDESDQGTIDFFEKYTVQLDDAYNAELNGQQYQGLTYDQWKKMFLADLQKYASSLSKEDYNYYYNSYK